MSSLQTAYHNIRAANGVKNPHLESHEVLEKEFESNPQVKSMHKAMHMVGVMCLYIRDVRTAKLSIESLCFRGICQVLFLT